MIAKNLDGELGHYDPDGDDKALLGTVQAAVRKSLPQEFEKLSFSVGIDAWMKAVYACNQYVDEQAPWALKKTDPDRMRTVLQTLFIAIRDLAIAIQPVIPEKAGHLPVSYTHLTLPTKA